MTSDPRLTLAHARTRLGGRVSGSYGRVGEVVRAGESIGVILFSDDDTCDVWIGDDKTKRIAIESISANDGDEISMRGVAHDARAFAALEEGASVSFDGVSGRLIEKCRWGGLVARADGRIFAVGFRRFARTSN